MKYLLILLFFLSGCVGVYDGIQFGDNYKHDKKSDTAFKRAGFTCAFAVLSIINKTKTTQTLIVNDSSYVINPKNRIYIKIRPGYNDVSCQFDKMRLHAVPCNEYRHVIR